MPPLGKCEAPGQKYHKLLHPELRTPKPFDTFLNHRLVRERFFTPESVPEQLLHHTFLALWGSGQDAPKLFRRREVGLRDSDHRSPSIQIELNSRSRRPLSLPFGRKEDLLLVAPLPDRVVPFQPEPDRVH